MTAIEGLRPEQKRDQILWELQAIRQHLHHVSLALTNAMNRIELIRLTVERIHPMPPDEPEEG